MAYYERDYFKDEPPRRQVMWPKLSRICKGLLVAYAGVNLIALFLSPGGDVAQAVENGQPLLSFIALHAPMSVGSFGVWQFASAAFLEPNLMAVLLTCLLTFWLIGSQVELALGEKRFGGLVAASVIAPNILACLLEPVIWGDRAVGGLTISGFSASGVAVFAAAAGLFGEERSFLLNIKLKWLILIFIGISLIIMVPRYSADVPPGLIDSLPAYLLAAGMGYGYVLAVRRRGLTAESIFAKARKQQENGPEEDYLAFARQFNGEAPESDAATATAPRPKTKKKEKTAQLDEGEVAPILRTLVDLGLEALSRPQRKYFRKLLKHDEQRVIDALLERISRVGISELSAEEKSILNDHSDRKRRNRSAKGQL